MILPGTLDPKYLSPVDTVKDHRVPTLALTGIRPLRNFLRALFFFSQEFHNLYSSGSTSGECAGRLPKHFCQANIFASDTRKVGRLPGCSEHFY